MFGSGNKRESQKDEVVRAIESSQRIVQAYGTELERSANRQIKNIRNLPADENTIKNAIILLCKFTEDDEYKENLIGSYILLSGYQPILKDVANLEDIMPDTGNQSLGEFQNQLNDRIDKITDEMADYMRWSTSSHKKMEALWCELCAAGIIDEDRRDRVLAMHSQ